LPTVFDLTANPRALETDQTCGLVRGLGCDFGRGQLAEAGDLVASDLAR
jgi:hypothetical protein